MVQSTGSLWCIHLFNTCQTPVVKKRYGLLESWGSMGLNNRSGRRAGGWESLKTKTPFLPVKDVGLTIFDVNDSLLWLSNLVLDVN